MEKADPIQSDPIEYPDLSPENLKTTEMQQQQWKIEVTLYKTDDGELQFDHNADGVQGVGDIYALHRVNAFYDALKEDQESLNEEGRQIMEKAKELNEELIGEIGQAVFQEGENDQGQKE